MQEEEHSEQHRCKSIQVYLTRISLVIIIVTVASAMFRFDLLRRLCVCIANVLAWSWIAFGAAIFIGLITFNMAAFYRKKEKHLPTTLFLILNILQSVVFLAGLILLIFFGARLLDVI
ncbi:MAG: hypothetical protein NTW49_04700 [Bacteroidia bacterium]|nr:hypothetical protein [Bacteroidia bacterium]